MANIIIYILLKKLLENIALPVWDYTNILNKLLSMVINIIKMKKNSINKFNLIGFFIKYLISLILHFCYIFFFFFRSNILAVSYYCDFGIFKLNEYTFFINTFFFFFVKHLSKNIIQKLI